MTLIQRFTVSKVTTGPSYSTNNLVVHTIAERLIGALASIDLVMNCCYRTTLLKAEGITDECIETVAFECVCNSYSELKLLSLWNMFCYDYFDEVSDL